MFVLRKCTLSVLLAFASAWPDTAGAQATTAFMLMSNNPYTTGASWATDGGIEDDQLSCDPEAGWMYNWDDLDGGGVGANQVNHAGSANGNFDGTDFQISWNLGNQVAPGWSPQVQYQEQPGLNVNAKHQGIVALTDNDGIEHYEFHGDAKSWTNNTDYLDGPVEFALITLDSSITPVGTIKDISWSFSLGAVASGGESAFDGSWKFTIGGLTVADFHINAEEYGAGDAGGYYIDSNGNTIDVSGTLGEGFNLYQGIGVEFYGATEATVSDPNDPSVAVSVEFDTSLELSIDGPPGGANDGEADWSFDASIDNP